MKRLASKVWARVTAIVLIVILVWICVFNCFGMVFLSEHNALFENRPGAEQDLIVELMQRDLNALQLPFSLSRSVTESGIREMLRSAVDEKYRPDESNFLFTIYKESGEILAGNETVADDGALLIKNQQLLDTTRQWTVIRDFRSEAEVRDFEDSLQKEYPPDRYACDFSWEWRSRDSIRFTGKLVPVLQCRINAALRDPMTVKDRYYYSIGAFRQIARHRIVMIVATPLMVACVFLLLAFLMIGAGRRENSNQIAHPWPDRIPSDLFALLIAAAAVGPQLIMQMPVIRNGLNDADHLFWIVFVALMRIVRTLLAIWLMVSFARRIKTHTLLRNTLILRGWQVLKKCGRYMGENLPDIWRGMLVWTVVSVIEGWFIVTRTDSAVTTIWMAEKALVTIMGAITVINFRKLERGSRSLRSGELDTKVSLSWMFPALKRHGENLNGISDALRSSLRDQMRSEKMQSELITNVSHDIKTPLTSIISYVELLKKDGLDSPHAPEYLEVLDRQSSRLKKLVGDLVEASKAASGSIAVSLENIDGNLLLTQAAGEYAERMEERELDLIYDLCEQPLLIRADPNLLWRVFDNLLNNAQKYAQKGTRIYLSSRITDGRAEIVFRNISDRMLNVSADELRERFVRGDSSRNTEGSGLGLSIARSLTELQGGTFGLSIDGDLFKIVIGFQTGEAETSEEETE